jgi:hypothetical protein
MKTNFHAPHTHKHYCISAFPPLQSKKIFDQAWNWVRYVHDSMRTEAAYLYWIRYFIRWAGRRHPLEIKDTSTPSRLF